MNIQGNEVVCKEFVMGYNAEAFTGANFFKLPKQINIMNNPKIICSGDFFNQRGEYGDTDLNLNITGNNIVDAKKISLINGTLTANIFSNNAASTEIFWNWAPTSSQISSINIIGNPNLGKVSLLSSSQLNCNISENVIHNEVVLKDISRESYIKGNIFLNTLTLSGISNSIHILNNLFKSRLLLVNATLNKTDISHNTFEGNGFGIYGFEPSSVSLKLTYTNIISNIFLSDVTFNPIEFQDFTQYQGLNFITNNQNINRNNDPAMSICNKIGNPNLIISPVAGNTSQRPTGQPIGFEYLDLTIQKKIIWWGSSWKDTIGNIV